MNDADNSMLNLRITTENIKKALNRAKRGNATGNDDIPIEVLNNDLCILYMVVLFNKCFSTETMPEEWSRGNINPILKNPKADARDPNNYSGITVISTYCKLVVLSTVYLMLITSDKDNCSTQGMLRNSISLIIASERYSNVESSYNDNESTISIS